MHKKIIFIASYPDSLINFRMHLINEFLSRNFVVIALAPPNTGVANKLNKMGVRYIPIELERNGHNPLKDILLVRTLYRLMSKEKPDIVFSYTIKPVIYGSVAARLAKVPKIFSMLTGTGYVFAKTNFKNRFIGGVAKRMFRFALRFNTKLFFQNKDNLASFLEHKLITKKQPVAIVNGSGVDVNWFSPAELPKNISFLMIARLLKDKGVREYAQAASILKKLYPNIVFKLVGWLDTNPNSITQSELDQWIKEGSIEYLGKLADVRASIKESSVYVLPSYGEGTPRTVLEAMAMQRPIITTDVPGCRETVINKQNGFLIPVCNVQALMEAMKYFILNPEEIKKMGKISRIISVEKYDVNKVNFCMLHEMEIQYENITNYSETSV